MEPQINAQPVMQQQFELQPQAADPVYVQPLIPVPVPVAVPVPVTNQTNPNPLPAVDMLRIQSSLKSRPKSITCPYCREAITTNTSRSCNCCNFCCCLWTACLCWCIFNCCRGKDLNCCDANHYCPKCNQLIYKYTVC